MDFSQLSADHLVTEEEAQTYYIVSGGSEEMVKRACVARDKGWEHRQIGDAILLSHANPDATIVRKFFNDTRTEE